MHNRDIISHPKQLYFGLYAMDVGDSDLVTGVILD